jgi:hypothetical protein
MNVRENLSASGSGERVVEVEVDDGSAERFVNVCTTIPIVEEPSNRFAVVKFKGAARRSTENFSLEDYSAQMDLIFLLLDWPEIGGRIIGETNVLLDSGLSFSETFSIVNGFVQEKKSEIKAYREERLEQIRNGTVEPEEGFERMFAAVAQETRRSAAEAEAAKERAREAEERAREAEANIPRGFLSFLIPLIVDQFHCIKALVFKLFHIS